MGSCKGYQEMERPGRNTSQGSRRRRRARAKRKNYVKSTGIDDLEDRVDYDGHITAQGEHP